MKTVLIPTDFSKTYKSAVRYALELYKDKSVNYILLNAFKVKPGPNNPTYEDEKANHQKNLTAEEGLLKEKVNATSSVSSILWMGKIDFLPQEIITENKVDLVIMGTEGVESVEEYIGKSHAGEFVSHVDVHTLIVPCCTNYEVPTNILFTTNYRNVKEEKTLEALKELLVQCDANLFVLYVNNTDGGLTTYQTQVKDQLHDYFNDYKVSFHEFSAEDVEGEIENFMLQYNIDMVSAVPLHNTFFDRLFHNSIAKKLAEHATKPVLILTNKK